MQGPLQSPGTGNYQLNVGKCPDNSFKGISVHEVLGLVTKLRVQNTIKIDKQDLDCGRMPN